MAQSPQNEPRPQPQLKPHTHLEQSFSLTPSIFTSFSALSKDPHPTAPEEKIARILQNLDTQHAAVRRNMVALLRARRRDLVRRAEDELAGLEDDVGDYGVEIESEEVRKIQEQNRRSRKEMLRRVRSKAREGAKAEEYQVRSGNMEFKDRIPVPATGNGDVEISGMGPSRSAAAIRQGLSLQLRDLVDRGVAELEAYDSHAAASTNMYKQALERRNQRRGSTSTASAQPSVATGAGGFGGGILRNGHEQSPLDMTAFRRMRTGMPIVGFPAQPVQPMRTFESVEEAARRGSK